MVLSRFVIEIVTETANGIDTAAPVAAADEMKTTVPEKDITKVTDTTIREASEDTDTNHLLLLTEALWFVGGYRIFNSLPTPPPPFHAEGKESIAAIAGRRPLRHITSHGSYQIGPTWNLEFCCLGAQDTTTHESKHS